jgi:hypothetical protein
MTKGDDGASRVRTRHYYDVVQLFRRSEDVQASIKSGDVQQLIREAAQISNRYFGAELDVGRLALRDSPALHPTPSQRAILRLSYESALERAMYHRLWIPFDELMDGVAAIRSAL